MPKKTPAEMAELKKKLKQAYRNRADLESTRMAMELAIHQLEDEIADSFGGTGIVLPNGQTVDIACKDQDDDDDDDQGKHHKKK